MSDSRKPLISVQQVSKAYPRSHSALGRIRTIATLLAGRPFSSGIEILKGVDLQVYRGE